MSKKWLALLAVAVVALGVWWKKGDRIEFLLGGALINAGYRLQDRLGNYDFEHHEVTPEQVWAEFLDQNSMASQVREWFPRTVRHPVIALVACMDARLDTSEVVGDTRRYYYVIRTAGSVLSVKEEEMLELAVANGVKVVLFTTHSDCAAERMAKDPAKRLDYPELAKAVGEREMRFDEFRNRPRIRQKAQEGQLLVKWLDIDTKSERVMPHPGVD